MVHMNVFWTRPQEYYDHGNGWRGTWRYDGGAFMNQASHYVDLLDWLVGPVESVQAMMSTTREIEAEDTGVLNLKWRNGALGSMAGAPDNAFSARAGASLVAPKRTRLSTTLGASS